MSKPKKANNLTGKQWLQNSLSIWKDIRRTNDERNLDHPATFPTQLASKIIESYTNDTQNTILDPFIGAGTTAVAAKQLGKNAIGFDVSKQYLQIAKQRTDQILPFNGESEITLHHLDARMLDIYLKPDIIDLVITSPPYWDILKRKRTADTKEIRDYQANGNDLSRLQHYDVQKKTSVDVYFKDIESKTKIP